jgi:hypothetical protein
MEDFDDEPDQEMRIEKLKAQLDSLGEGLSDHSGLSADMEEEFLKHILAFESADQTSLLQWLENAGQDVPPPGELDDAQLNAKLWEVINRMASLGAYLHNTNHLSDRQLYTWLFEKGCARTRCSFPITPVMSMASICSAAAAKNTCSSI